MLSAKVDEATRADKVEKNAREGEVHHLHMSNHGYLHVDIICRIKDAVKIDKYDSLDFR
jgi:hypothetical protein